MALIAAYISGAILLALSLRGPGHFSQFKKLFWEWFLSHYDYRFESPPQGLGRTADLHHNAILGYICPKVRGRMQRKSRLKFWVLFRLANGNIQLDGVFQHFCKNGCCKNVRDFLRKLKWLVAVLSRRRCVVINRSRWD